MLPYPHIDPVALHIGPLAVRWYGISYMMAFILGLWHMNWLARRYPGTVNSRQIDDLLLYIVLGVVLGGRIGYVLFYDPEYFFAHPIDIFKTWDGGMSYHGGMLGVIIAIALYSRRNKTSFIDIFDLLVPSVPIGLFLGRIANFINGELWGRVTDVPWAMVFPNAGPLPRHPSQLYEAFLEGVVTFTVLHLLTRKRIWRFEPSGLFLVLYGTFRFMVEFVRQPDNLPGLKNGVFMGITMGQVLSFPMILLGIGLLIYGYKHPRIKTPETPQVEAKANGRHA